MDTTQLFATASQWCWYLAAVLAAITAWTWLRQTPRRFAFFGYTAFSIVLAIGLWALSVGPIIRTTVPGAGRYAAVFDDGAANVVIAVAPSMPPETLELALLQAANNLYSTGRYSSDSNQLTIRARTLVNPEPGVSLPLYLGEARRSLARRDDPDMTIETFPQAYAQVRQFVPPAEPTV